jgi:hypothetical protein
MPVSPSYAASPLLDDSFPLPLDRPFTWQQALAAGVTSKVLRRLHTQGYLRRMLKGVYVAAQATDDLLLRARWSWTGRRCGCTRACCRRTPTSPCLR